MKTKNHPVQPLYKDDCGTLRFKANPIVEFLLKSGKMSMNDLAIMTFTADDRTQFAQLIGYSLGGAEELSYFTSRALNKAKKRYAKKCKMEEPSGITA